MNAFGLRLRAVVAFTSALLLSVGVTAIGSAAELKLPKRWECSAPLVSPEVRTENPSYAQKDPTIVFHDGKWHLFMTVKLPKSSVIEYRSFADWKDANAAERHLLPLSESSYFCAPQVFYFEPHKLWYLVYQVGVADQKKMWVAYSTTKDINDPTSWTQAAPMLDGGKDDPREVGGLDYWIICDDARAHLFITSNNGKMWRLSTTLEQFPKGFDNCELALEGKIFEASHTYKLKGMDKYLAVIEENGQRYFKAYVADKLDGKWTPVADSFTQPFASAQNVQPAAGVTLWADNISHGELIRDGIDQTLTVDPENLQFLFQGVLQEEKRGLPYGRIPWRLGLLSPLP